MVSKVKKGQLEFLQSARRIRYVYMYMQVHTGTFFHVHTHVVLQGSGAARTMRG